MKRRRARLGAARVWAWVMLGLAAGEAQRERIAESIDDQVDFGRGRHANARWRGRSRLFERPRCADVR